MPERNAAHLSDVDLVSLGQAVARDTNSLDKLAHKSKSGRFVAEKKVVLNESTISSFQPSNTGPSTLLQTGNIITPGPQYQLISRNRTFKPSLTCSTLTSRQRVPRLKYPLDIKENDAERVLPSDRSVPEKWQPGERR